MGRGCDPDQAFLQNLRRDHYELAVHIAQPFRLAIAFDELRPTI